MIKQLEYAESILRSNPMNAYDIAVMNDYQNNDDKQVVKDALYIEIRSLWLMSRFDEAVERAKILVELSQEDTDASYRSRALNVIGNVYYDLSNVEKALEFYRQGLNFAMKAGEKRTEAAVLNNIGEIYLSLEAYGEAQNYYAQSMNIAKEINDLSLYGLAQLNFGESCYKQKNYDDAFEYANIALKYFTEQEDFVSLSYAYFVLGKIHRAEGRDEKAKEDIQRTIDIMRRLQDHFNLNQAYIEMIHILIDEKKLDEALEYVEDGIDISERLNSPKELAEIALLAAKIHEERTEFQESLKYHKIYVKARLDYEKQKGDEQLNNINTQIKINRAEHEKEIYRLKNVELRKKTEEIQKLYNDMKIINNIGQDITSTLDIKKVLYLLYENINKLMDATAFGIILLDKEKNQLDTRLMLVYGQPTPSSPINLEDQNSLAAYVIRNKEALMSNNYDEEAGLNDLAFLPKVLQGPTSRSFIMVPLILQDEAIGAITVQSGVMDAYKDYHFNLIKALASYISIAIKNSQESLKLSQEIQERIKTQNELEILNEKLSRMSYMDALTQIPNRRSFVDYFSRELFRAKRQHESIALLIIDIDYFKEYNDNYGHVEGDRCLTAVASHLKDAMKREIDFVARYGGDEFVAVMSAVDEDGAYQVAEQMVLNIKEAALEHVYSPIEDIITITIGGITLVPHQNHTMEQVIHFADRALYFAKDKGRNQICFFDTDEIEADV
ncbi:MAG: GGDEF domain-containing protein [Clostridia bacterium]|nr:GGDEF domain-containing protein [Clostridia bacterium]